MGRCTGALTALLLAAAVPVQVPAQTPHSSHSGSRKAQRRASRPSALHLLEQELLELRDRQAAQQAQIEALMRALAARQQEPPAVEGASSIAQPIAAGAQPSPSAPSVAADKPAPASASSAAGSDRQAPPQTRKSGVTQAETAASENINAAVKANPEQKEPPKVVPPSPGAPGQGPAAAPVLVARQPEAAAALGELPLALRYKGVTITPSGFFAMEAGWRTRALNADINTPFNLTPFPGSNQGHMGELNLSARQSRLGVLFEGDAEKYKLQGYVEADFLSAGVTSNNNQSNSYTLRQRQLWGRLETASGFAVTAGQMFSLVTENARSTDVRTERLPLTIDPQYAVGFNWARQPGVRVQHKLSGRLFGTVPTVAVALENAQTQLGAAANAPANYILGGVGHGGGLLNAFNGVYSTNIAPDVLAKAAFDGKRGHLELGGIVRLFREQLSPLEPGSATAIANPAVLLKRTTVGGGVFGSGRYVGRYLELAAQAMAGSGTARYGSSQLGDVTVQPDGTLAALTNYHGLLSLEGHPAPKLDLFAYYGGEYNQRTTFTGPTGLLYGYGVRNADNSGCYALTIGIPSAGGESGSPLPVGPCTAPTRYIGEGTVGYVYRLVNSPKFGLLRYQMTYSYLTRQTWSGILNPASGQTGEGRATNNLFYTGLRYYLP